MAIHSVFFLCSGPQCHLAFNDLFSPVIDRLRGEAKFVFGLEHDVSLWGFVKRGWAERTGDGEEGQNGGVLRYPLHVLIVQRSQSTTNIQRL